MHISLPLQDMTTTDKIRVMEDIWNDLSKDNSGYSPPEWHNEILKIRKERAESGDVGFTDWEIAKKEIRNKIA
jgi:hypothetical protein